MNKKGWILLDICITTVFCIALLLSYLLEPYRIVVLILAIISFIMLSCGIITYINALKKNKIPIALPILFLTLLIAGTGIYSVSSESNDSDYSILISLILSLVLAIVTLIVIYKKFFLKRIWFLIGNVAFYFILIFLTTLYANYSLDMTKSTTEEFMIYEEPDIYKRSIVSSGTLEYPVKYLGDNPNLNISTLDLRTNYQFEIGCYIEVEWREGLFSNLYKVNYSNQKKHDGYFP